MTTAHVGTARDALGQIDALKMERCTQCQRTCIDYHLSGIGCSKHCPCPLLSELYCASSCTCCNDHVQLVLFAGGHGVAMASEQEGQA